MNSNKVKNVIIIIIWNITRSGQLRNLGLSTFHSHIIVTLQQQHPLSESVPYEQIFKASTKLHTQDMASVSNELLTIIFTELIVRC